MTDVETVADDGPPAGQPVSGRRRWASIAALVTVVAATAWLGWWLRHPAPLDWGGYGIGKDDTEVGDPIWTSLSERASRPDQRRVLTIDAVEPVILRDGGVQVDYFVCTLDLSVTDEEGVGGFGYGLSDRWAQRVCADLRPAEGTTMDLVAEPAQQLLVRVTPTGGGRTVITGHDLTFREGWQTGSETVAPEIRLRRPR